MKDKFCKTCGNWKSLINDPDDWWDKALRDNSKYGQCSCSKFVYAQDGLGTPDDGLGSWNDEYSNDFQFITGENFGCVHWKE